MQIDSENGETPTAENNADRRHYSDQERRLADFLGANRARRLFVRGLRSKHGD